MGVTAWASRPRLHRWPSTPALELRSARPRYARRPSRRFRSRRFRRTFFSKGCPAPRSQPWIRTVRSRPLPGCNAFAQPRFSAERPSTQPAGAARMRQPCRVAGFRQPACVRRVQGESGSSHVGTHLAHGSRSPRRRSHDPDASSVLELGVDCRSPELPSYSSAHPLPRPSGRTSTVETASGSPTPRGIPSRNVGMPAGLRVVASSDRDGGRPAVSFARTANEPSSSRARRPRPFPEHDRRPLNWPRTEPAESIDRSSAGAKPPSPSRARFSEIACPGIRGSPARRERCHGLLPVPTIVESGLDISNANTLILERADVMGLSQLHQLRGRVGRGRERGVRLLALPAGEAAHRDRARPAGHHRGAQRPRVAACGSR
jgi:hypothetical protein